jgi:hypothetical protein
MDIFTDYSSGNTISVVTSVKVTTDGADLRVNFTADTPGVPDSGVAFTSTVDDTEYPGSVSCTSGDGDGGGGALPPIIPGQLQPVIPAPAHQQSPR